MISTDMTYLLFFFFLLVLLIATAELMRRKMHSSQEFTRKFVHIATGILVAITPFVLTSKWPMIILGVLFAGVDYFAVKLGWLKGMHHTRRRSYGTVYYPLSFVILVLLLWDHHRLVFVCAMLIMAIADAAAAIVGENVKNPRVFHVGGDNKSLQGSATMFLSSLLIVSSCLLLGQHDQSLVQSIWFAAVVALFATACEAVSFQGSDNLTVPLGSALVLHYLLTQPVSEGLIFTFGMVLALLVAFLSFRAKFLNASGAVATMILGTIVFGIGRWMFSAPILTFFILSSLLSKVGKARKRKYAGLLEKTGARDVWQVAANGGLAGLILLMWYIWQQPIWYLLFAGSLASVTADTWGTEIGMLSKTKPRFILNFKPVPAGTSGGITLLGTLGAALGSLVLASVSAAFGPHSSPRLIGWREFVILFSSGLIASLFDSFLGATVQAKYRCVVCDKETEKRRHCHHQADFIDGHRWINNDVVNILAAFFGVAIAGLFILIL